MLDLLGSISVVLFDEHLTLLQVAGGVLVVTGGILAVLSPARNDILEVDSSVYIIRKEI